MEPIYPNIDDYTEQSYWHNYRVWMNPLSAEFIVNADCLSDAIDECADYAENHGWMGYFLTDETVQEYITDGYEGEIDYVGNHGLPILGYEIMAEEINPYMVKEDIERIKNAQL